MKCYEQRLIDIIPHQLRGSNNTVIFGGIYHLNWISIEPGFQRTQNYRLDHHGGFPQRSRGPARASPPAVLGQLRIVCNRENMVMINTQLHIDMVFSACSTICEKWRVVPFVVKICFEWFVVPFSWTFLLKIMVATHKVMSTAKSLRETEKLLKIDFVNF